MGSWIWGLSMSIANPTVHEAKIITILKGLELAWDRRIPKLIVDTDSGSVF